MAKPFRKEIDFAFFVVNFGYSKSDYESLTPKEKAFIYKAWENKIVSDTQFLDNAVFNAIHNAFRKKGKKADPLWKKKQKRLNKEQAKKHFHVVQQMEEQEGKGWVYAIYQANGRIKRKEVPHG